MGRKSLPISFACYEMNGTLTDTGKQQHEKKGRKETRNREREEEEETMIMMMIVFPPSSLALLDSPIACDEPQIPIFEW